MKKILKHWQNILLISMLISLVFSQILLWVDIWQNPSVAEKLINNERQANLVFGFSGLIVIFLLKVLCEPTNIKKENQNG